MAKKRIKYFCMLMSDILMVYLSDLLAWGLLFGFTEISKHWTFWRVLVILPLTVIIFECSMYVGKAGRNMGTQIGSKDVFCTAISAVLAVVVPALLVKRGCRCLMTHCIERQKHGACLQEENAVFF